MRVFVSAVSSELERARDTVAADLRARENFVKVQSDFRQEAADTLLGKLHDYIRACEAVVCLIGTRSGARPPGGARRADWNDVTTALRRARRYAAMVGCAKGRNATLRRDVTTALHCGEAVGAPTLPLRAKRPLRSRSGSPIRGRRGITVSYPAFFP